MALLEQMKREETLRLYDLQQLTRRTDSRHRSSTGALAPTFPIFRSTVKWLTHSFSIADTNPVRIVANFSAYYGLRVAADYEQTFWKDICISYFSFSLHSRHIYLAFTSIFLLYKKGNS